MKKIYRKPTSRAIEVEAENLCIDSSLRTQLWEKGDVVTLEFEKVVSSSEGNGEDALAPNYRTTLWGN